ncbi:MAG TPA: substrate-binding domain-containing protein [Verrucomicrobiae bacterium]|nr:substrate-binding domain-containing protein [Verrucomicrobiae bacterium]
MNAAARGILTILALGFSATTAWTQAITAHASDTLLSLNQKWADAYQSKHAPARVEVTGGSAPAVLAALADRKANIAVIPRAIRFKETQACETALGKRPTEFKVGVVGAAVFVHSNNPVTVLMYEELENVFKGKFRNWKQLGGKDAPITVYGVGTNTAAGELFGEEVLNGKGVTNDVQIVAPEALLKAIAENPNAIGFGAFIPTNGVRALEIKRTYSSTPVRPSPDDIANRIYPISRFLFSYLSPAADQAAGKAYLDWIRSDEGQQVAVEAGFYVLPKKWRATP